MLAVEQLHFRYGATEILKGITASATKPELIAIAGPNGAGKSTLLDLIAGYKIPAAGACRVMGEDASRIDRRELSRRVAHVPQRTPAEVPFTVEEVVLTGRMPFGRGLFENPQDLDAAQSALERVRLLDLRQRVFASLSGGEKQRVLLAAAICQNAPILLLDEPAAHMDPEHESWLWALLAELRESGCLILIVTHHLALAAHHADRVWLLDQGALAADGPPADALHPDRLAHTFHVPFHRLISPEGRVYLTYGF